MAHMPPYVPPSGSIGIPGVTFDALSGKAAPATALELDTLLGYCGISSGGFRTILNMQDPSSPLVDANGNSTFAITGPGTPYASYRNVIPGWSRLALGLTSHHGTDTGFVQQHGNLPDPSTHSYLMMCWVMIASTPTANQGLMSINDSAFYVGVEATTCRPIVGSSSGQQSRGNVPLPVGVPFLLVWKFDNANKVIKAYTPHEIIGDFWTLPGSGTAECDFGVAIASGIDTANAFYLWGAMAAGTSAEIKDAQLGLLMTTMGQSLGWYGTPTADASGKFSPITASQFQSLKLAAGTNVWPLQETSGIIFQDTANDCLLVAQAGVSAGNTSLVANRVALKTTDGTVASYANSTDSRLPNGSTESVAMLFHTQITAAAHGSVGTFWSWIGGTVSSQFCSIYCTTAGLLGIYNNALGPTGSYNYLDGARHPLLLEYNLTAGSTTLYTDKEIIAGPTFVAQTGSTPLFIGSFSGSVPAAGQLCDYMESIGGQAAEMGTAQARAYLNKLGWTVAW